MNEKLKKRCENLLKSIKNNPYTNSFWIGVIAILIPLLTWVVYLIGDYGFVLIHTSLTVGDALGFYGSFLAFLGTVALGALALWQNSQIEKKSTEYKNLLYDIELRKNMPKLQCKLMSCNGNFFNTQIKLINISENFAYQIEVTNFNVKDNLNNQILQSKNIIIAKDSLMANEETVIMFVNECLQGENLELEFNLYCVDKLSEKHRYKVISSIEDAKIFKANFDVIELGDTTNDRK